MDLRMYHWILAFAVAILLHLLVFFLVLLQPVNVIPEISLKTIDIRLSALSESTSVNVQKIPVETTIAEKIPAQQETQQKNEKRVQIKKQEIKVPESVKKRVEHNRESFVKPVVDEPIIKQPEPRRTMVAETFADTSQEEPISSKQPDKPNIDLAGSDYGQPASAQAQQAITHPQVDEVIRASYAANLSSWLARHKRYPRKAKRKKQQGVVNLEFTVSRSGLVGDYRIISSSGYQLLDEEVEKMLMRATPLPAFPETITENEITITVPISFKLS